MDTAEKMHGAKGDEFRGMDVTWLLDQWAERQPDKTFVVWAPFDGEVRRWSYLQLAGEARRFAAGLHTRGIGPGDFVLMHLDNSPDFLTAWFGCAFLGAVPVTTNTRSVTENVKYFAEVMKPACAVTDPAFARIVRDACGDATPMIISGELTADDAEALRAEPFAAVFADQPLPTRSTDPTRDFAVQFTSGTTSRPKATIWTNANALWGGKSMALWGMTETASSCIVTDPDHPGPAGTMGRPSPFYEVEVRKEDGSLAGPGEQGLLYIRGERGVSLFKEYYQNPEKTEEAFDASGALDTGDIVRIDEDGWMFFVNRDKDMLRVGGENVAALEIETAINDSGLALECAVVAQKHYMLGDVPAAFVRPSDAGKGLPEEELSNRILSHCREKLADFKVPRSVHIVDDFPRSTLDRISKNKLRDRLSPIESG